MKNLWSVIAVLIGLSVVSVSRAAILSWSATAPTVDNADIANLGVSAAGQASNVSGGGANGGDATYIADNRPANVQTFQTGSNTAGYDLDAVTFQQVLYNTYTSVDEGWNSFNGRFVLRIGTISGGVFGSFLLDGSNGGNAAMVDAGAPPNGNNIAGSGTYATLTLDSTIHLDANTTYAFGLWSTANQYGGPYIEMNGSLTDSYTGGQAYTEAFDNVTSQTGDYVFHLDMVASVPDLVPPAAPTGLSATAGDGSVYLDWNNNSEGDLASYTVYRSTTSGTNYSAIASNLVASVYWDYTAINGTPYYYVVTATDMWTNESDISDEVSATPASTAPTAAQSYPTLENGTYIIINRNSGKALRAAGVNDEDNVEQLAYDGGAHQQWVVQQISGDRYKLINVNANKLLDVYGYSLDNDANIQIYHDAGTGNQWFYIEPSSEGYYTIRGYQSGKNVEVAGAGTADGDNVVQYTANGGGHQEWSFEPVSLFTPANVAASTSNGIVTLTWNPRTSGSTRFNIKRSTSSGSGYTTIASGYNYSTYYDSMVTSGSNYYYVVSATHIGGETDNSAEVNATPLSKEQQWRWEHFGTISNAGNAADDADPDQDGLVNLGERIQGGDPNTNDASALFSINQTNPQPSVLYQRSMDFGDYDVTVLETGVLTNAWSPATGTSEVVSSTGAVQVVGFTSPMGTATTKFLRMSAEPKDRPRVIVTTDGEADDQASMVRFLLTCNEFEVEAVVNSSSQFHWVGGWDWNAFHPVSWFKDYVELYAQVYDNLRLHDPNYPSPEYLLSRWKVGNIDTVGEYATRTEGARFIAEILLDDNDPRPIWVQAWGGCNTIAAALKIIQEDHPERMAEVAAKIRLYLIWEQDQSYKNYISPNWEALNILTIIGDSFDCFAYEWRNDLPDSLKASHFNSPWAANNIVNGHGALCAAYVNDGGAFNAEGDSPSFLHSIPNGLRSMASPGWGGWGGRYVNIRNNVWMDIQPSAAGSWTYPDPSSGEWRSIHNSWAKTLLSYAKADRENYFRPIWRWLDDAQNDFAARADWCVLDYASANHHPVVQLKTTLDLTAMPGEEVTLDATPTYDPDGDTLSCRWWNYFEADTYSGAALPESTAPQTTISIPGDASPGDTIHMVCEVSDDGSPSLTTYRRVVITIESP